MKQSLNPDPLLQSTPRGYSHVVRVDAPKALIFVAGQASIGPDLEVIAPGDIEAQTRVTFDNIRVALASADATLDDIVDMTVYLVDIAEQQWPFRTVREEYLGSESLPTSTMVEVSGLALDGMVVEVDVIAAK